MIHHHNRVVECGGSISAHVFTFSFLSYRGPSETAPPPPVVGYNGTMNPPFIGPGPGNASVHNKNVIAIFSYVYWVRRSHKQLLYYCKTRVSSYLSSRVIFEELLHHNRHLDFTQHINRRDSCCRIFHFHIFDFYIQKLQRL